MSRCYARRVIELRQCWWVPEGGLAAFLGFFAPSSALCRSLPPVSLKAAAVDVVIKEAHGLHEGVDGGRADEAPAAAARATLSRLAARLGISHAARSYPAAAIPTRSLMMSWIS